MKWIELGPLKLDKMAERAPWALEAVDWTKVQMKKWHNKHGNICIGSVLKTNHR